MKFATDRLVLRWLCAELSMMSMRGSSESCSMKMNEDPPTHARFCLPVGLGISTSFFSLDGKFGDTTNSFS